MITEKLPICVNCKHFNEALICPAFKKKGIPDLILSGANKHNKPLPGQKNKIVFEPLNNA